jgi:hypothetical protein
MYNVFMKFIDRLAELQRLNSLVSGHSGNFVVLWGRRRVGKTRLLLEWAHQNKGIYTVNEFSSPAIQRSYFAAALTNIFPGLDEVIYPDWYSLLRRITTECINKNYKGPLILDEFPYLAQTDKALASTFQNWIDHDVKKAGLIVAIAGSSQRMMQGIVLSAGAPLYGRAKELMRIHPLPAGHICEGLHLSNACQAVEAFAVWGGIPYYWEIVEEQGADLSAAVDYNVLDPLGVLHDEPERLLIEETPSAITLKPILDTIGAGIHRLSEIAGRLNQPATALSRPLSRLIELGLIRRETPFATLEKDTKKALYKFDDPFFRFWFKVVAPHRSALMQIPSIQRKNIWDKFKFGLFSETWEELCRQSIPALTQVEGTLSDLGPWGPARRYWHGSGPEWDIVAESLDKKRLLLGEAKWLQQEITEEVIKKITYALLKKGVPSLDNIGKYDYIVHAIFIPRSPLAVSLYQNVHIIDASVVLSCLS